MASKFSEHGVVPDVVDQDPAAIATVTWASGVEANLGNVLTPTVVSKDFDVLFQNRSMFY